MKDLFNWSKKNVNEREEYNDYGVEDGLEIFLNDFNISEESKMHVNYSNFFSKIWMYLMGFLIIY